MPCMSTVCVHARDDALVFPVACYECQALCGCYVLCPRRLAYPEIFPDTHLYNTPRQLRRTLNEFTHCPTKVRPRVMMRSSRILSRCLATTVWLPVFEANGTAPAPAAFAYIR